MLITLGAPSSTGFDFYNRPRKMESAVEVAEGGQSDSSIIREWAAYRGLQNGRMHSKFREMIMCQERALHELKNTNQELYNLAVQVCHFSFSFFC